MGKIDKVIKYFRNLRENMVVGAGGFTSTGDQTVAGYDPVMGKPQKRYVKGGKGSRKKWLDYLKNK
jgi:hypothetical protein